MNKYTQIYINKVLSTMYQKNKSRIYIYTQIIVTALLILIINSGGIHYLEVQ